MSSYQDSRSDTNNKPMDLYLHLYLQYSGVLVLQNYSLSLSLLVAHELILYHCHAHHECSLELALEGGIASIDIQIFISSLPSLGKDPLVGTIAVKGM